MWFWIFIVILLVGIDFSECRAGISPVTLFRAGQFCLGTQGLAPPAPLGDRFGLATR